MAAQSVTRACAPETMKIVPRAAGSPVRESPCANASGYNFPPLAFYPEALASARPKMRFAFDFAGDCARILLED